MEGTLLEAAGGLLMTNSSTSQVDELADSALDKHHAELQALDAVLQEELRDTPW